MRSLIALSLSLALAGAAAAAEIKGSSRIDAVTVYPAGAEVTRTARVKLEKGEHTLLFPDLPGRGRRRLDPRRGQGHGRTGDRLRGHP